MREEQLAQHRVASGYQDESVVIDDAPGYAYKATMNMYGTDPTGTIIGEPLTRTPPQPFGGMPPAPPGGNAIPPLPPFGRQNVTGPSSATSGLGIRIGLTPLQRTMSEIEDAMTRQEEDVLHAHLMEDPNTRITGTEGDETIDGW
jgi:hypothetical protein